MMRLFVGDGGPLDFENKSIEHDCIEPFAPRSSHPVNLVPPAFAAASRMASSNRVFWLMGMNPNSMIPVLVASVFPRAFSFGPIGASREFQRSRDARRGDGKTHSE